MNTSQTALRTIPAIALTIAFCTAHAQTAPARKATPAQPAPAAKADRIMSIDELRVCMKLQQTNEKNAGEILDAQDSFKRDQDAVRAEQAEVRKASDARRTRLAELTTERDAIAAAVNDLNTRIQAAQKEADKTALEPERVRLADRSATFGKDLEAFNAGQAPLSERVNALNAKIDAINARSKTVNERVEPHKQSVTQWREQCGSRRYREEDEIVVKRELAAKP